MPTRHIAASLFLLLATAIPLSATAAESATSAPRSAEYRRGLDAIYAKEWNKAYEIFQNLWTHSKGLDPESDVLINLGQAELMIGKYRDSAEHLSIGILLTSPQDADVKERAGKGLARAKKKIGTLAIVAPEGTELAVNGKVIGTAPTVTEVFVDPGSVTVRGKHPTQGVAESKLEMKAADERRIELKPQPEPSSTTAAPLKPPYSSSALEQGKAQPPTSAPIQFNPPPPVEKKTGMETKTIVLIAGSVVTLAAAGTATYFGFKARSARSDTESMVGKAEDQFGSQRCSSPEALGSRLCADIDARSKDRTDAAAIYNVMLPVAGAAALATGLLYILIPSRKATTAHSFSLVPIADQRTGGVILQGGF